jgi:hypothetical protein
MSARDPIELSGGRWVTKPGGLRVWQPYRDYSQADEVAQMVLGILTAIASRPTTCECGCLLISRHENCPACQPNAQIGAA